MILVLDLFACTLKVSDSLPTDTGPDGTCELALSDYDVSLSPEFPSEFVSYSDCFTMTRYECQDPFVISDSLDYGQPHSLLIGVKTVPTSPLDVVCLVGDDDVAEHISVSWSNSPPPSSAETPDTGSVLSTPDTGIVE
jgi:hypothetical protein